MTTKIKISREDLLRCLEYVIDAADSTNINAILSNVLLQVDNNQLTMIATDHQIQMKTSCRVKSSESFEKIVPGAKLLSILTSLEAGSLVEMNFGERKVTLKSGQSQFDLSTQKRDDYVLLGETGPLEKMSADISSADLAKGLRRVHYATSKESHRLCLNGVLLEQSADSINLVATDAHRLAVQTIAKSSKEESKHIIPKKTVDILLKRLQDNDKIEILKNSNVVHFKTEVFELTANIIQENYPDYQAVIPRNNESQAVIERKPLLAMIRHVNALAKKDATVIFTFKSGVLEIEFTNNDNDRLEEKLDIEYSGEDCEIGFNISYIQDAVDALVSEKVSFKIKDNNASILVEPILSGDNSGEDSAGTGEQFCYVVMPIRL